MSMTLKNTVLRASVGKKNKFNQTHFTMRSLFVLSLLCFLVAFTANAQVYVKKDVKIFSPQNNRVLLLEDNTNSDRKVILFKTSLAVNTDGTAISYHPQDPNGKNRAINNVCNAIAVRKVGNSANLCLNRRTYSEAIGVFERWRNSNYTKIPSGYTITWKNVLAKITNPNGIEVPCIFRTGKYSGYFGSLTALNNGLPLNQQGECQSKNQLDSLEISHLVLAGGANPVRTFGARVGDLIVAFNPQNNRLAFAVIGDTGPPSNLGEGSVKMNMTLLGKSEPPKNKGETYNYTVNSAIIAVIPASNSFQIQKPFTAENIEERIKNWQQSAGFQTPEKFIEMVKSFQTQL